MIADVLTDDAWLVIIDPQVVFASSSSEWGSPMFSAALTPMHALAERYTGRTIVTRFVPQLPPQGSWADYYAAWPFAARPGDDEMYALVPEIADVAAGAHRVDEPTFGKWGEQLRAITGDAPTLVLAGVSTDCCVVATALAAADAGARVHVVASACAGSDVTNHERALDVMRLFAPQITVH